MGKREKEEVMTSESQHGVSFDWKSVLFGLMIGTGLGVLLMFFRAPPTINLTVSCGGDFGYMNVGIDPKDTVLVAGNGQYVVVEQTTIADGTQRISADHLVLYQIGTDDQRVEGRADQTTWSCFDTLEEAQQAVVSLQTSSQKYGWEFSLDDRTKE